MKLVNMIEKLKIGKITSLKRLLRLSSVNIFHPVLNLLLTLRKSSLKVAIFGLTQLKILITYLRKPLAVVNIVHSEIEHDCVISGRFKRRSAKHHRHTP